MSNNGKKHSLVKGTDKFNELFHLMVEREASDLHLRVPSPPVFRIDGKLTIIHDFPPVTPQDIETLIENITTEEQKGAFLKNLRLDFAYSIPGLARFRVSAIRQRGSINLAFRLIPFRVFSIDELGLPQICKEPLMTHCPS